MIKKNNIKFIGLGLPSKILWGNRNFNNNKYYQWGELCGYSKNQVGKEKIFYWDHSRFCKDDKITKYNNSDKLLELLPEDDIVTQTLGNNYRIPRKKDFEELLKYTNQKYLNNNVIFKSKRNNNSLRFSYLGYSVNNFINSYNECGRYMSSTGDFKTVSFNFLLIGKITEESSIVSSGRCCGYSIRPIKIKEA